MMAKLLLEPVDHPVAAKNLHLGAVGAGDGRRVRRNEGRDLQILGAGGVDGGRGAVAQAADVRLLATRADHFAGLVGGGGQQGRAFRNTGGRCGRRGDVAHERAGCHQFGQPLGA